MGCCNSIPNSDSIINEIREIENMAKSNISSNKYCKKSSNVFNDYSPDYHNNS